jgi:glycosyltransferase involved in cell wall biosynthesis
VLLVVPYFMPERTVGALRVSYWARYLVRAGCRVTVVVPRPIGRRFPAEGLDWLDQIDVHELPMDPPRPFTTTFAARSTGVRRLRRRIVATVGRPFVPDRHADYWKASIPFVRRIAESVHPDVVLTSSPPHSVHIVGRELRKLLGIPWVADFRDPYLTDPRFAPSGVVGRLLRRAHQSYERSIYETADLVVHAIRGDAADAHARYPERAARMRHIPNGFPVEMTTLIGTTHREPDEPWRVVSAGVIGEHELAVTIDALDQIVPDQIAPARDGTPPAAARPIELRVCGPEVDGRLNARHPRRSRATYLGRLAHRDALREILSADVLLAALSVERSRTGLCSTKLYEYMATGRPIVAINPTAEDLRLLEGHYDRYWILHDPSPTEVAHTMARALEQGQVPAGQSPTDRPAVEGVRQRFPRRVGCAHLLAELERLAGTGPSRPVPAAAEAAPRLSVGLPVHNGEAHLEASIRSLLAQDFEDFELIISDNASTDATPAIIERWAAQDDRIRAVRNPENLGGVVNFNQVLGLARGELFKWASSNDVCAPTFLSECIEVLDRDPEAVVAYPKTTLLSASGDRFAPYDDDLELDDPRLLVRLHRFAVRRQQCNAVFGVMRTAELRSVQPFGAYPGSDVTLLAELALRGTLVEVPKRLFLRRITASSPGTGALSRAEVATWFDPAARPSRWGSHGRVFVEIERSIGHSPLPPTQRAAARVAFSGSWALRRVASRGRSIRRRANLAWWLDRPVVRPRTPELPVAERPAAHPLLADDGATGTDDGRPDWYRAV